MIYGFCSQQYVLCHCSYSTCVLASIMSSELCGRDSVPAHTQLNGVYLVSTLDVMHVIKCTRLSPLTDWGRWCWGCLQLEQFGVSGVEESSASWTCKVNGWWLREVSSFAPPVLFGIYTSICCHLHSYTSEEVLKSLKRRLPVTYALALQQRCSKRNICPP